MNYDNKYIFLTPSGCGSFAERLNELHQLLADYLKGEKAQGRQLRYCKVFFSDSQNQEEAFLASALYGDFLQHVALTTIEQPPLDGSKIALLVKTSTDEDGSVLQSLRLSDDEARGSSSYLQTMRLFEKYIDSWRERPEVTMARNLVRTWIYVADIDVNYKGVVEARNDVFRTSGLTADTHFVASTGIGGYSSTRHATVAMDFLTYPAIHEEDKRYLTALDHLNPTKEYGVAFERGTRLQLPSLQRFFISGTASIDSHGAVMHLGDVEQQACRLLENISALLADGGAGMDNVKYFIIYLRDLSDFPVIDALMRKRFTRTPFIIVLARVCRPEWLIEMECIAEK